MKAYLYNGLCKSSPCIYAYTSMQILDVVVNYREREVFLVAQCTRCGAENLVPASRLEGAWRKLPPMTAENFSVRDVGPNPHEPGSPSAPKPEPRRISFAPERSRSRPKKPP